jgi:hypothetical protein
VEKLLEGGWNLGVAMSLRYTFYIESLSSLWVVGLFSNSQKRLLKTSTKESIVSAKLILSGHPNFCSSGFYKNGTAHYRSQQE